MLQNRLSLTLPDGCLPPPVAPSGGSARWQSDEPTRRAFPRLRRARSGESAWQDSSAERAHSARRAEVRGLLPASEGALLSPCYVPAFQARTHETLPILPIERFGAAVLVALRHLVLLSRFRCGRWH